MHWLPIALLSAFLVASADTLTKKVLSDYSAAELVVVRFVYTALILTPLLFIYPLPTLPLAFWKWIAALLPLEILAMLLYMKAIRDNALSMTLPYLAFSPVFITLTGYVLLGETVSARGFGGILLVVSGAYLLNIKSISRQQRGKILAPFRAILTGRGSRLMLSVAALYSVTSVMGKAVLQYVPETFFAPFYFILLAVTALAMFSLPRPQTVRALWRRPGWHVLLGTLLAAMILAHLVAIQMVEVAYMISVKRVSLLFGILYGAFLFKESHPVQHFLAGALMVAGVMLIAV